MKSKNPLPDLEEEPSLWLLLAAVLLFAPLFWAGNVPLALIVLELAALGLLGLRWTFSRGGRELTSLEITLVGGILFLPLLQLIPLPPTVWAEVLPGRAFYADALREALGEPSFTAEWRPIAIIPRYSESAWLALLPPVAVFLAARSLSSQRLQSLAYLFLGIAVFQAVLGLLQYGAGRESFFCLGNIYCGDRAVGTYIGRAHLAGLLEMALPITLALLISTIDKFTHASQLHQGWRRRLFSWGVWQGNRTMLYTAMTLVILLGIVFTRSRAGILLAMAAFFLSFFLFAPRIGAKKVYGTVGLLTFAGAILALEIGLAPIVDRFTSKDPLEDGRWTIFAGTLHAAGEFFPLGSGGGSFVEVFQRFQPDDFLSSGLVHRAHNDYLEWLVVGGLPAAILVAVAFFLYCRQWVRVWQGKYASTFSFIQIGAGLGLFLLLLHTAVDFNLHIPANAIFFAFLAGIFFCPPEEKKRSWRNKAPPPAEVISAPPPPRLIPPENQTNPFAD